LWLIFWLGWAPMADATMCRVREAWTESNRYGQEVCILKLKRSAKNYWEYRAKVSIDGEQQKNPEVYNCRDRTLTRKGKYPIPFQPNSPGELVCQTFQRQINTYKPSRW
jgi:hypothetical protein